MFTSMGLLNSAVRTIVESVEHALGGTVNIENDPGLKTVTLTWTKNDKTVQAVKFQKKYAYDQLMKVVVPYAVAQDFVKSYRNAEKPVVAEPTAVEPKPVKAEEPKVVKGEELKVVLPKAPKAENPNREVKPGDSGVLRHPKGQKRP